MIHTKTFTLTIGIPAYNEGKNIYKLLSGIKNQIKDTYKLEKVILVLDGSKDNTATEAKRSKLSTLHIHKFAERQGKANALEYIKSEVNTDALLLMDADVEIRDVHFIDKILKPIIAQDAAITSAKVVPKKATSFFTKILYLSNQYKQSLYEAWNKGNNLYTCHGRSIAMSKSLYKKIKYRNITADDALAFITSRHLNLKYVFVKDAKVYYKLPQTFKDHQRQSTRFLQTDKEFAPYFKPMFVKDLYSIPLKILCTETIKYLFTKPLNMTLYIGLFSYVKIVSLTQKESKPMWEMAESSKIW